MKSFFVALTGISELDGKKGQRKTALNTTFYLLRSQATIIFNDYDTNFWKTKTNY